MTCIVGFSYKKKCYVGGDSAGSEANNGNIAARLDPKVFVRNGYLFGYTSSFRMGDILQYICPPPEVKAAKISLREHLIVHWIPVLREKLKAEGCIEIKESKEKGGTFIVAYRGALCTIHDDFQVSAVIANYCAVGSGYMYALGAFHATSSLDMKPKERVTAALSAAAFHNAYVREPFTIIES